MNSVETKSSNASSNSGQSVQEYIVKMPKNKNRRFNVMRFSNSHKIDVTKWSQVKMERENNLKEFKAEEELPKYGLGSEFGREQREESRRKKYGILTKKYNPDDQPWILKMHGKGAKKYKGIREGGVSENTSYYVFTQAADGTFEAYPVEEWYNFTPIQRYKALSAEEAEEEFGRRDKVLNYFSIMVRKRLQKETNEEEDEEGEKQNNKKKKKNTKDFKISDMDDWAKESSESCEDDEGEEEEKKGKDKKKKKEKVDDEGREESDEGDFDDREVDYITDSSGSEGGELEEEKNNREMKGVEDEEALRKLFASDEEEEEEGEDKNKEEEDTKEQTDNTTTTQPPHNNKKPKKEKGKDSSGDSSSETSDSDFDDTKIHAVFMQKQAKKNGSDNSASSSRANTPTRTDGKEGHKKRKLTDAPITSSKKVKLDTHTTFVNSVDGITEESIRRYLSRKPMTASELLHKFKSKKTKLSVDQLVTRIADLLKKMDLQKRNVKGKMYLSLPNNK